jgi:hypothetical protein
MGADPRECLLVRFEPAAGGEALTVPAPSDLRWDTVKPGGHKSMSCTVTVPAGTAVPEAFAKLAKTSVVDRRTGRVLWYGRLTEPGQSVTGDGTRFALTGEGGTEVDGWRQVYGLVDRSSESWQAVGDFQPAQQAISGDLSPGGDYDFTGYDDLTDFGDFDVDPSDGSDFPGYAGYDTYLGFLQDPTGTLGLMSKVEVAADGLNFWSPELWTPGYVTPGASASTGFLRFGTPSYGALYGRLTCGTLGGMSFHKASKYGGNGIHEGCEGYVDALAALSAGSRLVIRATTDPTISAGGVWAEFTLTSMNVYAEGTPIASTVMSLTSGRRYVFTLGWDGLNLNIAYTTDIENAVSFTGGNWVTLYGANDFSSVFPQDGWWWGCESSGSAGSRVDIYSASLREIPWD